MKIKIGIATSAASILLLLPANRHQDKFHSQTTVAVSFTPVQGPSRQQENRLTNQMYKWLVARGTITIIQASNRLSVDIDAEGASSCILTAQDAKEIADILTEQARTLWEASEKSPEPRALVDGDSRACQLTLDPGVISLLAHDSKALLALSYDGQGAALLTVTQTVALVQLIQHMLRELPPA